MSAQRSYLDAPSEPFLTQMDAPPNRAFLAFVERKLQAWKDEQRQAALAAWETDGGALGPEKESSC